MGEKNEEVSIEEVSVGIVGSEESTGIDWLSLVDEEEESKEARLEKYKKSLAEVRKLKRALKVMIEYLGSIKQSDDGFQIRPGTVYR